MPTFTNFERDCIARMHSQTAFDKTQRKLLERLGIDVDLLESSMVRYGMAIADVVVTLNETGQTWQEFEKMCKAAQQDPEAMRLFYMDLNHIKAQRLRHALLREELRRQKTNRRIFGVAKKSVMKSRWPIVAFEIGCAIGAVKIALAAASSGVPIEVKALCMFAWFSSWHAAGRLLQMKWHD